MSELQQLFQHFQKLFRVALKINVKGFSKKYIFQYCILTAKYFYSEQEYNYSFNLQKYEKISF